MSRLSKNLDDIEAVVFDLMGTCTDWKTAITRAMESTHSLMQVASPEERDSLARRWRAGFFHEIHRRFDLSLPTEDIDITHRRVLNQLLAETPRLNEALSESDRDDLVHAWHHQVAWPDSIAAIDQLKKKLMVIVLANGTTRMQLDIIRSSGLKFHTLLSSQLLNLTKPSPEIYLKALSLLDVVAQQTVMVAAHAYDLRAAKSVGMKTIYVRRDTEDEHEDLDVVRGEVDLFLDGSTPLKTLAEILSA